ncbi:MAG: phosphate:Na+ symporter [Chitinophagales bacterium]|jgi:phosphate:Na+ symporter
MEVFFTVLKIIGALGFFMYGMKVMSEGIQKAAGDSMRKAISTMTQNRFLGVGVGFLITALLQSSSATTVMTVSFVNAGLLSLVESAGIMMGANVGTTITGWLVNIVGKFKISAYALPIIAIGFPMLFAKRGNLKNWGQFLIGFALLFMGLSELKHSVPELGHDSPFVQFFTNYADFGIITTLIFVILGTLVTVVMQSSSAAMTLTLTLVMAGVIPFQVGAAMILGENIGTTITAEVASLVGNVHAKRSARIHSIFNIIGVTWMVLALPYVLKYVVPGATVSAANFMGMDIGNGNPFEDPDAAALGLAVFHTLFNMMNVILLLGFVPWLVKMAIKTVKAKDEEDEEFHLQFINSGLLNTPALSIVSARKELDIFAKVTEKMGHNVYALFFEKQKNSQKLIDKVRKHEDVTDKLDLEITQYLAKISEFDINLDTSKEIRSMLSISNDLERIGDIYYEMTKNYERMKRETERLPANAKSELEDIMNLTMHALKLMRQNLDQEKPNVELSEIIKAESAINAKRKQIFTSHFGRLEKGVYAPKIGVLFIDFVNRSERIGDHVMNIHEAVLGKSDLYEEYDIVQEAKN